MPFREAQRQGGHVRKGKRAITVIYWKWRTPEELAQRAAQTGKEGVAPCAPLVSAGCNFEQVEGVARPADDLPPRPADRLTVAEQVFDARLQPNWAKENSPAFQRWVGVAQVELVP